jgi:hypothetical protein
MMESKRQWWKHTKWNEHLNTQMETLMVTIKTFISGHALETKPLQRLEKPC